MNHQTSRTFAVLGLFAALAIAGCTSPSDPSSDGPTADNAPSSQAPVPDGGSGPDRIDLGSASGYAILAKAGISTTGSTSVVGHLGVSPSDGTSVTGFGLVMDASNEYSTSSLVSGRIYAADYSAPSPTRMTQAVADMEAAYSDAAGRSDPTATELGAGNIGAMTLRPGLYKWSSSVQVVTDLTLSGAANDVWVFQVEDNLLLGPGAKIVLSGGAQADNVFWQVAGQTTIGVGSQMQGNILGHTAIVFNTGASLTGRALSQTAVTLDANEVTMA
jgi:hypothetical protein